MILSYTDPKTGDEYIGEGNWTEEALTDLKNKMGDKYHDGLKPHIHWTCTIEESDAWLRSMGIEV